MKRSIAVVYCSVVLATIGAAGCQTKQDKVLLPASVVNDACGAHTGAAECQTDATTGCAWMEVGSACPAGAECPTGICVTPDPCGGNQSPAECGADDRCAWSALADAVGTTKLCPLGQNCRDGGFCHGRDASGGGCSCVQPVACPANADCPAVQCDCAGTAPPGGTGGGARAAASAVVAPAPAPVPPAPPASPANPASATAPAAIPEDRAATVASVVAPVPVPAPPCPGSNLPALFLHLRRRHRDGGRRRNRGGFVRRNTNDDTGSQRCSRAVIPTRMHLPNLPARDRVRAVQLPDPAAGSLRRAHRRDVV